MSSTEATPGLINYRNIPCVIGSLVSSKLVTMHELQTIYGAEDAYNLLELICVDAYNSERFRAHAKRKAGK